MTSEKVVFTRLFNEKAEEFCKDLVTAFPEVNQFKQLKSTMLLLKNVHEKKPREIFNKFITPQFREKIISFDESFFLNEVHNHVVHVEGVDTSQWESIVELLRSLWVGLTADNKDSIWKYFQVLVAINDKICTL